MNKTPFEIYGIEPDRAERASLSSKPFRIKFDFHRLEKVKKNADWLNRYERKIDSRKKKRLRENLELREQVLVLAERFKKKNAPRKFYKRLIQNKSYFNKDEIIVVTKKTKDGKSIFCWLTNIKTKKFIKNRFQRQEIYLLSGNFI